MHVTQLPFGTTPMGEAVELFTPTSSHQLVVRATNGGGILVSLLAPDRGWVPADVVLGHDSLDGYLDDTRYLGAIGGRFSCRIANARFAVPAPMETRVTPAPSTPRRRTP